MDKKKADEISDFVDSWLIMNGLQEISAPDAAGLLVRAGILKSCSRPERVLRGFLVSGLIPNSFRKGGRFWFLTRLPKVERIVMRNHHRVIFPE